MSVMALASTMRSPRTNAFDVFGERQTAATANPRGPDVLGLARRRAEQKVFHPQEAIKNSVQKKFQVSSFTFRDGGYRSILFARCPKPPWKDTPTLEPRYSVAESRRWRPTRPIWCTGPDSLW